jgi:hypothetical protein
MGVGRQQEENWTGDESLHNAVLRMLVDKYKPMRDIAGGIKTADEKLKANPPLVNGRLIEEMGDDEKVAISYGRPRFQGRHRSSLGLRDMNRG